MSEARDLNRCILFDWGDTLMHDFHEYSGPMYAWPRVEALPHVPEVLAQLRPHWLLVLATNAADSDEPAIARALQRAGLADFIDKIYCQRRIGHRKPAPQYFEYILHDLGLDRAQAVMVGDDFTNDVAGANRCGIRAVWLSEQSVEQPADENYRIIRDFRELPGALEALTQRRA